MARRKERGYGTAPIPKVQGGPQFLPPPPDGKAPVRLPLGQGNPQQPPPMEDFGGQNDDQMMQMILRAIHRG